MPWSWLKPLLAPLLLALCGCAVPPVHTAALPPAPELAAQPAEAPGAAAAAVPAVPVATPTATPAEVPTPVLQPVAPQQVLEATRRSARSATEWLARGVDSWFGKRPFADGGKVSDGRLSLGVLKREDQASDVDLRLRARFHLPNVEEHAYLFIGRDDARDVVRDTPDTLLRQQQLLPARRTERSFIGGLGVILLDAVDFRLGLGSAARPYAQARIELPWVVAPGHHIDFRETFFWTDADRFGSTTVLSYDMEPAPTLALRWLNAATITQVTRNLEWSSSLGLYKSLGAQRLVSLEALFSGTGTRGSGVGLSDRGLLAKWVQPVHKNWVLAELVVGHFWPRPNANSERGRAWALGGSLTLMF